MGYSHHHTFQESNFSDQPSLIHSGTTTDHNHHWRIFQMAQLLERTGNNVKFKVTVPSGDVSIAFTEVFSAVSRNVKIPGFRPGRAPKNVVEKRIGLDYIQGEVRDYLVNKTYQSAVKELELIPVTATITPGAVLEGSEFEYTVEAENYPEVTLPAWEGYKLETVKLEIGDQEVTDALEDLRNRQASYEPVERTAEANDLLNVEILEGEDAGQTYPVYLERADEGIRTALLGQSAEAEVDVPVTSGADGEEAQTLKIKILDIKAKNLPELDDDFAKTLELEDLAELRVKVREDLENRSVGKFDSDRKDELIGKLSEGMTVVIPEVLITRRREALETDLKNDLERQGIGLEAYREYLGTENKLEEFEADLVKSATERVRRDLALEKLAEGFKTELTSEEWRNALENFARSNRVSVARLGEVIGNEGINNLRVLATRDKALTQAIEKLA
jgi:trigger factor